MQILVDGRQRQAPATPANGQTSIGRRIASLTFAARGQGRVQILRVHDVEAAEVLFGFHERAVSRQHLTIGGAHDSRGIRRVQPAREDPHAARLHLGLDRTEARLHPLHLVPGHRLADFAFDTVG
jgi:hypothetical protein